MAACPDCGQYVDEDEEICPNCGYEIRNIEGKLRDDEFGEYDPETEDPDARLGKDPSDPIDENEEEDPLL